jgi:hypothetical protein
MKMEAEARGPRNPYQTGPGFAQVVAAAGGDALQRYPTHAC